MYASFPTRNAEVSSTIRWFARASGVVLMAIWLVFFFSELLRSGFGFDRNSYIQGAALAVVFTGYILGWVKEVPGGILAVIGTIVYCLLGLVTECMVGPAAALFAVPGFLYLIAHQYDTKRIEHLRL
jgi:hypothetical protein